MNHELAKRIMELPEGKEFTSFIQAEIYNLDTLEGLDKVDYKDLEIEVLARLRAKEKLVTILDPLLNTANVFSGSNNADFVA